MTILSGTPFSASTVYSTHSGKFSRLLRRPFALSSGLAFLLILFTALTGCGTGGYAGGGIAELSARTLTLDAGQSFPVTATVAPSSPTVQWSLAGTSCSGSACGTLSSNTGANITYVAPSGITTSFLVTLTAKVPGTQSASSVAITVNPDPVISGVPPTGFVGQAYATTLSVAGGTVPLTWRLASGSAPPGLTFNPATGLLSGTPTTTGTFSFTVQAVDSSAVPFTVSAVETVTIYTALSLSGLTPAGTVGSPYAGQLLATGGSGTYTFSLLSGALPSGLSLVPATGSITGNPTAAGTYTFTAQAQDSAGNRNSAVFSITVSSALTLTAASLPNGTVGVPYSAVIGVSGGAAPYACVFTAGTLPAGLTLGPNCLVSGTPTVAGTVNLTVRATDSNGATVTGPEAITINPAALAITTGTLPNGTVGIAYSSTIGVSGGTAPYACTITAGTLQAGLILGPNCLVSGTPTVAGTAVLTVKATDSSNPTLTTTGQVSLTINAATTLTPGNPPIGTIGVPYMGTIPVTGGSGPYMCKLNSGTLPSGLTLGTNCVITGTPISGGPVTVTIGVTDSGNPPATGSGPVTITINPAALAITTGTLPNGTVGIAYSSTIGVSGGTAPYTCTITAGTLQAGLTLGPNCLVSGTPTVAGTAVFTVKATDSSNPTLTTTGQVSLTINPAALAITTGTLPNGTVGIAYSSTIGVSGGTAPYTCTITAGTLQAGLILGPNCLVSGTPTIAGTAVLTVKATDSSNPTLTTTGQVSLTINPAALAITTGTLPNGTVGIAYSSTIGVSGGTAPYTCTITAGTLQAGLTLGPNCLVSGTPTVAGTAVLTVKATDSSNPTLTTTGQVSLTINPAALAITTGTLPNGTVGIAYSSTIGVSGGTAPYTCTITAGTLQAGLTLGPNCLVSGTPTVAGTAVLTVKATDSSNPTLTTTGQVSLTINPAPVLVIANPPSGTVNVPYMGSIPVTGGTGPYTCTLNAGTLPAGLTLNADCSLTGTPTAPGATTVTVGVTDSGKPPTTTTGTVTITINPAPVTLTLGNPPPATVGTPYTGLIPVTGGTSPYTCTLNAGTVPAGLTLTNCTLTGTPTAPGTTILNITAVDSTNPHNTVTGPVTVLINPIPTLTFTGSLPNAILNQPYTQTLAATGGVGPYTYATTAGALPPGITLSTGGIVSGIPTAVGAYSFTVTATDSETTPQTASLPLVLLVTYAPTATDGLLQGPYAFLFQGYDDVALGLAAYQTATVGSFTASGTGVLSAGELDANHQSSNPTGATIASAAFLGTYTIGADYRGMLTITTLNPSGTVAGTHTYAIAVKAPVAPATTTAQGSLIEFDSNQLAGTRGSGTFLQQTSTSFATGLTGSYAFGLQGDTPCLPTCTVALTPGPVAAVGEFTVASGAITGQSDANIANQTIVNQPLTGTSAAADTNGRVQLSLTTAGTPTGFYPTDYAVYIVNANQAFILSTDKHSAAVLLAGSAQSQTLTTFANTSLSGPFIGYENSPTNPGLVGTTLNNTLNLATATIFRSTANAAGTCTVTNVDEGGTTALVNGLTGLGSGAPILNALLGTYQSLGNATCATAPNGRVVLNYPAPSGLLAGTLGLLGLADVPPPARIVYLSGIDRGYFLESGYAGLGQIEPQTGSPYSLGSFNGTYIYLEVPASSVATTNTAGVITANGAGSATTTQDLNTGVGTVNILQLGVTGTYPYTAPDATTGRFVFNTTLVVYEISPGRFVLVDTNPLTTSPSVVLLD